VVAGRPGSSVSALKALRFQGATSENASGLIVSLQCPCRSGQAPPVASGHVAIVATGLGGVTGSLVAVVRSGAGRPISVGFQTAEILVFHEAPKHVR